MFSGVRKCTHRVAFSVVMGATELAVMPNSPSVYARKRVS